MKVNIVIPLYNAEKTIVQCVDSVLKNSYPDFEILIIDDCSRDDSRKLLKKFNSEKIKILRNKENSGASCSRNFGIKNSNCDLVILLDTDSYVPKDWIADHVKLHEDPDLDIVGGGVVGIHRSIYGKADGFCSWWTSVPFAKDFYLKRFHIPTNNMSIKKSVFDKIGYFNEKLRLGGEDAEFCFRALKNRLKIYFKSDLVIYHHDRNDLRGFLNHQANWGKHAVEMRKAMKMEASFLMPKSKFLSYFYILPLALIYSGLVIIRWFRTDLSVVLYFPIILYGKIVQMIGLTNSFDRKKLNLNDA